MMIAFLPVRAPPSRSSNNGFSSSCAGSYGGAWEGAARWGRRAIGDWLSAHRTVSELSWKNQLTRCAQCLFYIHPARLASLRRTLHVLRSICSQQYTF